MLEHLIGFMEYLYVEADPLTGLLTTLGFFGFFLLGRRLRQRLNR